MPVKTRPIPMLRPEEIDQFWSRVDQSSGPDACWEWQGDRQPQGYGQLPIIRDGKPYNLKSHRLAYFLGHGQDPGELCVCHHCDNPSCCNPDHLFLGTHADNAADMVAKGRSLKGRCVVRLIEEDIRQIRSSRGANSILAGRYGVSRGTISNIRNYRTHKHMTQEAQCSA